MSYPTVHKPNHALTRIVSEFERSFIVHYLCVDPNKNTYIHNYVNWEQRRWEFGSFWYDWYGTEKASYLPLLGEEDGRKLNSATLVDNHRCCYKTLNCYRLTSKSGISGSSNSSHNRLGITLTGTSWTTNREWVVKDGWNWQSHSWDTTESSLHTAYSHPHPAISPNSHFW